VHLAFSTTNFKKEFKKCFLENYLRALEIHNLLILALKIAKQIL
jgi:hypothetical protein